MGQEEVVVVASWEKAVKTAAVEGRDLSPESPRKVKQAPARRLSVVPPPPGRPSVPGSRSFTRARAVRPEDDPFLAAYLACTRNGSGGVAAAPKGRRRFTWPGLGLSCKSSGVAVEQSMVKLAKRPELDPRDA
jgi:hypothetical protein